MQGIYYEITCIVDGLFIYFLFLEQSRFIGYYISQLETSNKNYLFHPSTFTYFTPYFPNSQGRFACRLAKLFGGKVRHNYFRPCTVWDEVGTKFKGPIHDQKVRQYIEAKN